MSVSCGMRCTRQARQSDQCLFNSFIEKYLYIYHSLWAIETPWLSEEDAGFFWREMLVYLPQSRIVLIVVAV